jgi:hypothetical protein
MKRPGYREAIEWLAGNDDCYWIGDHDNHGAMLSVSASLVRDLWGVTDERLIADLRRALGRVYANHEALRNLRSARP